MNVDLVLVTAGHATIEFVCFVRQGSIIYRVTVQPPVLRDISATTVSACPVVLDVSTAPAMPALFVQMVSLLTPTEHA